MASIKIIKGESSLVAVAIHNGHDIRPELLPYLRLSENERSREEDPYTAEWTKIADNQVVISASRFEVDVNRPRESAIYTQPEDAWGLQVWNQYLPPEIVEKSLHKYDQFYTKMAAFFDDLLLHHKNLIVYDLHSYNHRRQGYDQYAPLEENPEINLGTQNLNRKVWGDVVDVMIETIRTYNFEGRYLDVRENVKFGGGYFGQWLRKRYQDLVCPISIEVKKFFMDEWTGQVYETPLRHIREMLISTIQPVLHQATLTPAYDHR